MIRTCLYCARKVTLILPSNLILPTKMINLKGLLVQTVMAPRGLSYSSTMSRIYIYSWEKLHQNSTDKLIKCVGIVCQSGHHHNTRDFFEYLWFALFTLMHKNSFISLFSASPNHARLIFFGAMFSSNINVK